MYYSTELRVRGYFDQHQCLINKLEFEILSQKITNMHIDFLMIFREKEREREKRKLTKINIYKFKKNEIYFSLFYNFSLLLQRRQSYVSRYVFKLQKALLYFNKQKNSFSNKSLVLSTEETKSSDAVTCRKYARLAVGGTRSDTSENL